MSGDWGGDGEGIGGELFDEFLGSRWDEGYAGGSAWAEGAIGGVVG